MIKTFKKLSYLMFSLITLFVLIIIGTNLVVNALLGIGTVKETYSRTILPDMVYTYTDSNDGSPQKNYVIDYNPKTSGVKAIAMFGEYEFGGDPISTNVALAEKRGYTVIAGVNASPFDTSNGVTVGTIISEGRIISAKAGVSGYDSFAIRNDGTMFIGRSNLSFSYVTPNNETISVDTINKQKKTANNNVYLFTDDYYTDSTTLAESTEVILTKVNGEMSLGKDLTLKVEEVKNQVTRTKIEKGKYVLTGPNLAKLGGIKVGDELVFSFKSNDTTYDWNEVSDSICGFYQILKDGSVCQNIDSDSSIHPRTTIGFKADGNIVLYVVDGRQPNFSIGLSDRACAEYMKSLGCVDAIRMDGGGSSAMTIRFPGDTKLTTVNSPSDGQERHDSDCLLLVLSDAHDSTVGDDYLLHAYPNSIKLLQNTVTEISVKATDSKYNPKATPDYTMEATGGVGSIVGQNGFKAGVGSLTGTIKITGGGAETSVNVSVTDQVDELYANVNNLAMGPGESYKFSVKAYYKNDKLLASNESFTWSCDEKIGTINEKGEYLATSDAGVSGYVYVSYGSVTAKVLVTVGELPKEITGFENDACGSGAGEWRNNQVNGGTGACYINDDLRYVRYGSKSLKIEFNLANTTGTVGTQINNGTNLAISGTPTAIGMWVYATPSAYGAWIRIQYLESGSTGAKYADFGTIDWEGWKYLEAPIEEGIKYPIRIQYLIRIMGVSESQRINGVIYVDQLRAVYGFKNDDFDYPVIENILPADNYAELTTQTVSFDIKDTGVGINPDATSLSIDGKKLDNLILKDIQDGYNVSWTPSALQPLSNGVHNFTIRCEDHAGNFVVHDFTLFVGGGKLEFSFTFDDEIHPEDVEGLISFSASKTDFNKLELVIAYDPDKVDINDITVADGINLERKVINRTKKQIQVTLSNNGYSGDGSDILVITYSGLELGDALFSFTKFDFTRTSYGDYQLSQSFDDITVKITEKPVEIDYSPLVEKIKLINMDAKDVKLLDEFDRIKEAKNLLDNLDETLITDPEVLAEVAKLEAIIASYNKYITKVHNAINAIYGEGE